MKTSIDKPYIESRIKDVDYLVMKDGRTTICTITMANGFTVNGFSACVSAENFDAALGRKYSYEDAFDKLWPFEGYLLAERLSECGQASGRMSKVTRSYVCGVTCTTGGPTCNGYCKDQKIPSPGTYELELLNFEHALLLLKGGQRIARLGWNGKGMFVYLVPAASYPAQTGAAKAFFGDDALVPYNAYFAIKNVDNTVSTWVPSVNDLLADDWVIVG